MKHIVEIHFTETMERNVSVKLEMSEDEYKRFENESVALDGIIKQSNGLNEFLELSNRSECGYKIISHSPVIDGVYHKDFEPDYITGIKSWTRD